ncbi:MAG: hypothetical protein KJ558_14345 [Gammaproteobacteria bacterium]|nr:hypothetical protein [Gammaproteobacteria bacterium]MBU1655969.1 hypothetical protein [Gammaproteobacteria bacterium]MBU1962544.1 hypothetical protein [Gammaproteobacteria bacterium]
MKTIAKFIFYPLIFAALVGAALWYTRPDLFQIGLNTPDNGPLGAWNAFPGQGSSPPPQAETAGQADPYPMGGMPWSGMPPPMPQTAANTPWQPPMRYTPPPPMAAPVQSAPPMQRPLPLPLPPRQEDGYLNEARAAYWKQDTDATVAAYKGLTEEQGDNPDVWGELGNAYLSQGKMDEATEAYAKAADLLIERGLFRQAAGLLNIIGWKNPDEALRLLGAMANKQREIFAPAQPQP